VAAVEREFEGGIKRWDEIRTTDIPDSINTFTAQT